MIKSLFVLCFFCLFFFFKQKTAYEMRISDWSSDVCSSDLGRTAAWGIATTAFALGQAGAAYGFSFLFATTDGAYPLLFALGAGALLFALALDLWAGRSEEHTSELQSLMRISYAVFCLKKKKKK